MITASQAADKVEELQDLNPEPDEIDTETCPECGCKTGYTPNCSACHEAYIDAMETADDQMGDATP